MTACDDHGAGSARKRGERSWPPRSCSPCRGFRRRRRSPSRTSVSTSSTSSRRPGRPAPARRVTSSIWSTRSHCPAHCPARAPVCRATGSPLPSRAGPFWPPRTVSRSFKTRSIPPQRLPSPATSSRSASRPTVASAPSRSSGVSSWHRRNASVAGRAGASAGRCVRREASSRAPWSRIRVCTTEPPTTGSTA